MRSFGALYIIMIHCIEEWREKKTAKPKSTTMIIELKCTSMKRKWTEDGPIERHCTSLHYYRMLLECKQIARKNKNISIILNRICWSWLFSVDRIQMGITFFWTLFYFVVMIKKTPNVHRIIVLRRLFYARLLRFTTQNNRLNQPFWKETKIKKTSELNDERFEFFFSSRFFKKTEFIELDGTLNAHFYSSLTTIVYSIYKYSDS